MPDSVEKCHVAQSDFIVVASLNTATDRKHVLVINWKQLSEISWQKTASPSCHPSRLRMDSSDPDPHLIHGCLEPHESAHKQHLHRFTRFLYSSPVCPTHANRHTDHATCDICSNEPHHVHCVQAMRPNPVRTIKRR